MAVKFNWGWDVDYTDPLKGIRKDDQNPYGIGTPEGESLPGSSSPMDPYSIIDSFLKNPYFQDEEFMDDEEKQRLYAEQHGSNELRRYLQEASPTLRPGMQDPTQTLAVAEENLESARGGPVQGLFNALASGADTVVGGLATAGAALGGATGLIGEEKAKGIADEQQRWRGLYQDVLGPGGISEVVQTTKGEGALAGGLSALKNAPRVAAELFPNVLGAAGAGLAGTMASGNPLVGAATAGAVLSAGPAGELYFAALGEGKSKSEAVTKASTQLVLSTLFNSLGALAWLPTKMLNTGTKEITGFLSMTNKISVKAKKGLTAGGVGKLMFDASSKPGVFGQSVLRAGLAEGGTEMLDEALEYGMYDSIGIKDPMGLSGALLGGAYGGLLMGMGGGSINGWVEASKLVPNVDPAITKAAQGSVSLGAKLSLEEDLATVGLNAAPFDISAYPKGLTPKLGDFSQSASPFFGDGSQGATPVQILAEESENTKSVIPSLTLLGPSNLIELEHLSVGLMAVSEAPMKLDHLGPANRINATGEARAITEEVRKVTEDGHQRFESERIVTALKPQQEQGQALNQILTQSPNFPSIVRQADQAGISLQEVLPGLSVPSVEKLANITRYIDQKARQGKVSYDDSQNLLAAAEGYQVMLNQVTAKILADSASNLAQPSLAMSDMADLLYNQGAYDPFSGLAVADRPALGIEDYYTSVKELIHKITGMPHEQASMILAGLEMNPNAPVAEANFTGKRTNVVPALADMSQLAQSANDQRLVNVISTLGNINSPLAMFRIAETLSAKGQGPAVQKILTPEILATMFDAANAMPRSEKAELRIIDYGLGAARDFVSTTSRKARVQEGTATTPDDMASSDFGVGRPHVGTTDSRVNPIMNQVFSNRLTKLEQEFTQADGTMGVLSDPSRYESYVSKLHGSNVLPEKPRGAISYLESPEKLKDMVAQLNPEEVTKIRENINHTNTIRDGYADGSITTEGTLEILMMSSLTQNPSFSREETYLQALSGGVQEVLPLFSNPGVSNSDLVRSWNRWVTKTFSKKKRVKGAGEIFAGAGSPTETALREFGDSMIALRDPVPAWLDESGETHVNLPKYEILHRMAASPKYSARDIRRFGLDHGVAPVGRNEVLSTFSLMVGKKDGIVLDQVQAEHLWGKKEHFENQDIWKDTLKSISQGRIGEAYQSMLESELGSVWYQAASQLGLRDLAEDGMAGFHWATWKKAFPQTLEAMSKSVTQGAEHGLRGAFLLQDDHSRMDAGTLFAPSIAEADGPAQMIPAVEDEQAGYWVVPYSDYVRALKGVSVPILEDTISFISNAKKGSLDAAQIRFVPREDLDPGIFKQRSPNEAASEFIGHYVRRARAFLGQSQAKGGAVGSKAPAGRSKAKTERYLVAQEKMQGVFGTALGEPVAQAKSKLKSRRSVKDEPRDVSPAGYVEGRTAGVLVKEGGVSTFNDFRQYLRDVGLSDEDAHDGASYLKALAQGAEVSEEVLFGQIMGDFGIMTAESEDAENVLGEVTLNPVETETLLQKVKNAFGQKADAWAGLLAAGSIDFHLTATRDPSLMTVMHEISHVWEHIMPRKQMAQVYETMGAAPEDVDALMKGEFPHHLREGIPTMMQRFLYTEMAGERISGKLEGDVQFSEYVRRMGNVHRSFFDDMNRAGESSEVAAGEEFGVFNPTRGMRDVMEFAIVATAEQAGHVPRGYTDAWIEEVTQQEEQPAEPKFDIRRPPVEQVFTPDRLAPKRQEDPEYRDLAGTEMAIRRRAGVPANEMTRILNPVDADPYAVDWGYDIERGNTTPMFAVLATARRRGEKLVSHNWSQFDFRRGDKDLSDLGSGRYASLLDRELMALSERRSQLMDRTGRTAPVSLQKRSSSYVPRTSLGKRYAIVQKMEEEWSSAKVEQMQQVSPGLGERIRVITQQQAENSLQMMKDLDPRKGKAAFLKTDRGTKVESEWKKQIRHWVNQSHDIEIRVEGIDTKTAEIVRLLAHTSRASMLAGEDVIAHGSKRFERTGPNGPGWIRTGNSLVSILADMSPADVDLMVNVLMPSQRQIELSKRKSRGEEAGYDKISDEWTTAAKISLEQLEKGNGANFKMLEKKASEVRSFMYKQMARLVEVGRIDQKTLNRIIQDNKAYIPFYREETDLDRILQEITGDLSTGVVTDPLSGIVTNTQRLNHYAETQHYINSFLEFVDQDIRDKGDESWRGDARRLYESTTKGGKGESIKKGMFEMTRYENGTPIRYEVSKGIYDGLKRPRLPIMESRAYKVASQVSRIGRAGATITPAFTNRNTIRDQMQATINSEWGYNPLKFFKSMIVQWNPEWLAANDRNQRLTERSEEFFRVGAGISGAVESGLLTDVGLRSKEKDLIKQLHSGAARGVSTRKFDDDGNPIENTPAGRDKLTLKKVKQLVRRSPLRILEDVSSFMERGTRIALFDNALEKGATLEEAIHESKSSSVDFSRSGQYGRAWNGVEKFLNASFQDTSKGFRMTREMFARGGRDRTKDIRKRRQDPSARREGSRGFAAEKLIFPGRGGFAARVFAGSVIPSMLNMALNWEDEDYHKLHEWDRMLFYHAKMPGGWFARIPRPIGVVNLAGYFTEKVTYSIFRDDKEAMRDFMNGVLEQTPVGYAIPSQEWMPDIVQPIADIAINKDPFRDQPIRPTGRPLPSELAGEGRFGAIETMAGKLPYMSSYDANHLISGYFATLGRQATDIANRGIRMAQGEDSNFLPENMTKGERVADMLGLRSRSPIGLSSKPVKDFYELYERAEKGNNALKQMEKNQDLEGYRKYMRKYPEARYFRGLSKARRELADIRKARAAVVESGLSIGQKHEYVYNLDLRAAQIAALVNLSIEEANEGTLKMLEQSRPVAP